MPDTRPAALALALCTAVAGAGHAHATPQHFDIVGLHLGMTQQQARDAIRKHDPSMQMRDKTLHYT